MANISLQAFLQRVLDRRFEWDGLSPNPKNSRPPCTPSARARPNPATATLTAPIPAPTTPVRPTGMMALPTNI